MQTRIAKRALILQTAICFLFALLIVTTSFHTGLVATKAERLSKALQGAQNEFRERSAQMEVSVEIADWIKSVRGLHPVLMVVFLALGVIGIVGVAAFNSMGEPKHSGHSTD
jgi:hypothetical protein